MNMSLEKLGKYRIDGVLGKGAMGVVYKGFDPFIERVVAIKSIHKQLLQEHPEMGLIARFKNEAQAAGRLTHPNIVAVYEYGETEDNAFIAMEYVHSTSLANLMQEGRPNELGAVVSWISQLLRALDYAHGRGVVHRDVKPANLLIERDGHLKITDFGIARLITAIDTDETGDPDPGRFGGRYTLLYVTGAIPGTDGGSSFRRVCHRRAAVPAADRLSPVQRQFA